MKVSDVIDKAVSIGACRQSGKATDWKSLCWLFFSPQGIEFCKNANYPTIEMFREMKPNIRPYCVYVEDSVAKENENVALIGCFSSELFFSGVEKAYKVILMHGATAVIHISNYAVVRVENISGMFNIINDGTGKVLV